MEETKQVTMTAAEQAEFEAFRIAKAKAQEDTRRKALRSDYNKMIDEELERAIPELMKVSESINNAKQRVLDDFSAILEMKQELFRLKDANAFDNKSHTFTTTDGTKRIIVGQYYTDDWADTADMGVAKINGYIQSLATDEKSRALVSMVMKLLAKDAKGNLNAQRILQLRTVAEESGIEELIDGVKIIAEAYRPVASKTFVKAYVRNESNNAWMQIPLGMTEA